MKTWSTYHRGFEGYFILFLVLAIFGTFNIGFAQTDSVRWSLTSSTTADVFGNLTAGSETFSNMTVRNYYGGVCQKSAPDSLGTWSAETGENASRYLQFAVSPAANYNLTVTSVQFYIGWAGTTNHIYANVYYSASPTFATRTQLGSTITLQNSAGVFTSFPLNVVVNNGSTFYVRIYPWDNAAATGKSCGLFDVGIYGNAVSVVSSSLSAAPSNLSINSVNINGSKIKAYSLSGLNLNPSSGSIAINAPSGFSISTSQGSGYASSLTIPYSGGTLSATTVYVKFSPTSITSYSGVITNDGGGATTQNVSVTGNGVAENVILGIFVATTGSDSNPGTYDQPFLTIPKAVSIAQPGDSIFVRAGRYLLSSTINLSTNGTSVENYCLYGYPGDVTRPVLDFSAMAFGSSNRGIVISGHYWHIKGLEIYRAGDNGMFISGGNNIVEYCALYENQDSGLQLSNGAANNQIINCDSYYNYDAPNAGGNADGFSPKLDVGTGNSFYGCRAWQNSDDGWDCYEAVATVTLVNCWTFNNGYIKDGSDPGGNGNGFKLGGNYTENNITLNQCLSFGNKAKGFDQNHNRGSMILINCTGYNNGGNNYSISEALNAGKILSLTNCAELGNKRSIGSFAILTTNSWPTYTVTVADFVSLDTTGIRGPRKADGSLPEVPYMHLATGSQLIDAGTYIGPGSFNDIGCFEYTAPAVTYTITSSAGANGSISPLGTTTVASGGNQTYSIVPATGYHVEDVLVDRATVGAVSSYSFTNVTTDHTINAAFALSISPAPIALAATNIDSVSFTAQWNTSVGATSYQLDVAIDSLFNTFIIGYINLTVNGTSQSVTNLQTDTVYYYRVRAVNAAGTSSNSNTIAVRTVLSVQQEIDLTMNTGWNFVSVPLVQSNYASSVVFPGVFGSMFGFRTSDGSYFEATNLELGQGYWAYYTAGTIVHMIGTPLGSLSIPCAVGWNLIGSRTIPVPVSALQVNAGVIFGSVFRYNTLTSSYEETATITPGEAHWIYVTQSCMLTMP